MNSLNKIIFLNSVHSYLELGLDRSIHILGKNGTGKSSLLSAMLAFYTGKCSALEHTADLLSYYFPHDNSWILYEVKGSNGPYTVAFKREKGKLSYCFINGDYEAELFQQNGKGLSLKKVLAGIKMRKLHHEGPFEDIKRYQAILFGYYSGKDKPSLRKYCLTTAPGIEHVPALLEVLFLGKVPSNELLRKCLYSQQVNHKQELNLDEIREELSSFRSDLQTIKALENALPHGNKALDLEKHLQELRTQEEELGRILGSALESHKQEKKVLQERLEAAKKDKVQLAQGNKEITKGLEKELKTLHTQLGEVSYKIGKAKALQEQYEQQKITEKLNQYAELSHQKLISLFQAQGEDKDTLKVQGELEQLRAMLQKEEAFRKILENQLEREKQIEILSLNEEENLAKEEEAQHNILVNIQTRTQEIQEILGKKLQIESDQSMLRLIDVLHKKIHEKRQETIEVQLRIRQGEEQLIALQKRRKSEIEEFEKNQVQQTKLLNKQLVVLRKEEKEVSSQIANSGRALLGWLEKNFPDWQKSIGKILKDEVIFNPFLGPSIERINDLLFGIRLDLSELPESSLTLTGLSEKKNALEKQIQSLEKEGVEAQQKWLKQQESREKYYKQKNRELKRKQQKDTYALQQIEVQIKRWQTEIEQKQHQAKQKREAALLKLSYQEEDLKKSLELLEKELEDMRERKANRKIEVEEELKKLKEDLQKEVAKEKKNAELVFQRFQQAGKQGKKQGSGKSARSAEIIHSPFFLDTLQEEIFQYKIDKRNWIDRLGAWESEKRGIAFQIENRLAILTLEQSEGQKAERVNDEAHQAWDLWEKQEEQLRAWKKTAQYARIKHLLKDATTDLPITEKLDHLLDKASHLEQKIQLGHFQQKEILQKFLSYFEQVNEFNFPVLISNSGDQAALLKQVEKFVEEEEFLAFMKAVQIRHANLLGNIAGKTQALKVDHQVFEGMLNKLNMCLDKGLESHVYHKSRFAIQANRSNLFQILRNIHRFYQEHTSQLGGSSLFNQGDQDAINKEAYLLLTHLEEELTNYPVSLLLGHDLVALELLDEEEKMIGEFRNMSLTSRRAIYVLLGIEILHLLVKAGETAASIHLILDNLSELDMSTIQEIQVAVSGGPLKLITASSHIPGLLKADTFYQIHKNQEQLTKVSSLDGNSKA